MTNTYESRRCLWLFLALIVGCSSKPNLPAVPDLSSGTAAVAEPATHAYRACQADSDCVYVQNGCCDCANGGGALAVRRDQLEAFRANFKCEAADCTAMMRDPGCESGTVSCRAGLCEYTLK